MTDMPCRKGSGCVKELQYYVIIRKAKPHSDSEYHYRLEGGRKVL